MSKLNYPTNGIHPLCNNNINSCIENLNNAISNCGFDIPADFPHRNNLQEISNTLSNYRQEANSINSKLKNTDNSFRNLSDQLTASAAKIAFPKVTKRERMIK
ncbi:hypothetical protein IKD82_01825 [Candidatus Saccharibacteria bacterium]|nr:hypothetical protein [Candidatus Saccharibacteria bacterium]